MVISYEVSHFVPDLILVSSETLIRGFIYKTTILLQSYFIFFYLLVDERYRWIELREMYRRMFYRDDITFYP